MHLILGASGHIGSALAHLLLAQGEPVTVVLHTPQQMTSWQQAGAEVAVVDVHDVGALRRVFRQGQRLFLLNPPAAPSTDTAVEERKTLTAILAALDGSGLHKIVAESTYGAQPGAHLGDLGVLYELEQGLAAQRIPTSVIRAAYYFSNWDSALQTAQQKGKVHALYPPDFKLPMVAPQDIAQVAARLLTEYVANTGLYYVEGPQLYSPTDVAEAFGAALQKPVTVESAPRAQWLLILGAMGFSPKAAASFAAMTATTLDQTYLLPDKPERGTTTLQQYVRALADK